MATSKKSTSTKKRPATKVAAKKSVTKSVSSAKRVASAKSNKRPSSTGRSRSTAYLSNMRSFHIAKDEPPFTTFKITRQTVYWVILVGFIVFVQLWIIKLQIDVAQVLQTQQLDLLNTL